MDITGTLSEEAFADFILHRAKGAQIELTEAQAALLSRHVQIMLEWNSRFNLTRITTPEEVVVKHILDSIAPAKYLPSAGKALDVGAGAGFPGIPLKIVNRGLSMVLLESSGKKVAFLTAAAAALGLEEITALHGSWQDFRQNKENRNKYQLIVMRALRAEPEHISRLASGLLAPGGVFARWEVLDPQGREDLRAKEVKGPIDMEFHGDFGYSLPGVTRGRAVRLWKKK
ncbi:MAG: 16S rRNA (guanine(527)-N(7))-methyltransferase RsmG [Syntrophobacteraceae bacterium]